MLEQDVTIINKLGLHARAAAKLVNTASGFQSEILLSRNGREINGKSIMGVMMLAAAVGSEIHLKVQGDDEQHAMQGLLDLINDRFGEGE